MYHHFRNPHYVTFIKAALLTRIKIFKFSNTSMWMLTCWMMSMYDVSNVVEDKNISL